MLSRHLPQAIARLHNCIRTIGSSPDGLARSWRRWSRNNRDVLFFSGGMLQIIGSILEWFIGNTFPFVVFGCFANYQLARKETASLTKLQVPSGLPSPRLWPHSTTLRRLLLLILLPKPKKPQMLLSLKPAWVNQTLPTSWLCQRAKLAIQHSFSCSWEWLSSCFSFVLWGHTLHLHSYFSFWIWHYSCLPGPIGKHHMAIVEASKSSRLSVSRHICYLTGLTTPRRPALAYLHYE